MKDGRILGACTRKSYDLHACACVGGLAAVISLRKSACVDRHFQSFSVIRINSEALFPGPSSALIRCRPNSTVDNEVSAVYLMPFARERRESPL